MVSCVTHSHTHTHTHTHTITTTHARTHTHTHTLSEALETLRVKTKEDGRKEAAMLAVHVVPQLVIPRAGCSCWPCSGAVHGSCFESGFFPVLFLALALVTSKTD